MEKLEKIGTLLGLIAGVPIVIGAIAWLTGFFKEQNLDIQILVIAIILITVFMVTTLTLYYVRGIFYPKKPRLVKAFNEPDTYLFHRGAWRRIPDWQTRDYLAHLLGFRPGEEDIKVISKVEIEKFSKGAPLESIYTYARIHQANQV